MPHAGTLGRRCEFLFSQMGNPVPPTDFSMLALKQFMMPKKHRSTLACSLRNAYFAVGKSTCIKSKGEKKPCLPETIKVSPPVIFKRAKDSAAHRCRLRRSRKPTRL